MNSKLWKELAAKKDSMFEACTRPDGEVTNEMVGCDNEQKDRIDGLLEEIWEH